MTRPLALAGAVLVAACTSLNVLLGLRISIDGNGITERHRPAWIRRGPIIHDIRTIIDATARTTDENEFTNGRFPAHGTASFASRCPWTTTTMMNTRTRLSNNNNNCTILAQPLPPYQDEGISNWLCQIVAGHLLALQTGCTLLLHYAKNIDMHQVLTPLQHDNWNIPTNLNCHQNPHCLIAQPHYNNRGSFSKKLPNNALHFLSTVSHDLAPIPQYRFAYGLSERLWLYQNQFQDLEDIVVGFQVETGMACSLNSLFQLAQSASHYEPMLFTKILPTLHSPDAFVIALYIRTGQTDFDAMKEERQRRDHHGDEDATDNEDTARHVKIAMRLIQCALHLEQEEHQQQNNGMRRMVWMVVTDSHYLKQWIPETYDDSRRHVVNSTTPTKMFNREVLTTTSHGAHTRMKRKPLTSDFAEAMIDWYLIGESNVVVSDDNSPSFGGTAALRTARPLYKPLWHGDHNAVCTRTMLLHNKQQRQQQQQQQHYFNTNDEPKVATDRLR